MNKKPETAQEARLWTASAACELGSRRLNAESQIREVTPTEFAVFCLLKAVKEIAEYLQTKEEEK